MTSKATVADKSIFTTFNFSLSKFLSITLSGFLLIFSGQLMAQTINEIRTDQPSSDLDEYFELSGAADGSLDGLSYIVIGDGAGGSGVVESVTDLTGLSLTSGGYFVAAESTFTLGVANLTTSLGFENSDNVTHMLVSSFTGSSGDDLDTNDDGSLDVTPWTAVMDCVAIVESIDSGELLYCATGVGPDGTFVPSHVLKCPAGWVIGQFDPVDGGDTPGKANDCGLGINEIRIDQSGSDNDEYFELSGTAGDSLDGMSYIVIGDGAAGSGVIESVTDLDGSSVPLSGYFVAAEATFTLGVADLTTASISFENSDNVTHLLVNNFTGSNGDDLDTNDDGTLDVTPWDVVLDCVALIETVDSGDQVYCETGVGPDGTFVPAHAIKCPEAWAAGEFDIAAGDDTPGAGNICIVLDSAPTVSSTSPTNGATGVPIDSNIVIDFSEPVTVADPWVVINCTDSGSHAATQSGGPGSYTLDLTLDFVLSESCIVDISAAQIADTDADDPPDTMAAGYSFTFTISGPPVDSPMLINEIDADQVSTDSAEFIELFDGGTGSTSLDGLVLVLFNGSSDTSYQAFDLDGFSTNASGYFVVCGDLVSVVNCDADVGSATNLIQNGADAAALYLANSSDFPNGTSITTSALIDALVYDTNDSDDAGLLPLLNPGQPQIDEGGEGDSGNHSNQRCPNGAGGGRNTTTYMQDEPTPGAENDCVIPLINEVDADSPDSDIAEFIELITPGTGDFPLDGYSLVLYNGSDDASYLAFDLDGYSTNTNGYFVLCGNAANVANCDLDVTPDGNLIQNGADAVALVYGNADDYPIDTPVSVGNLVDALVYDTSDSDDAGLLILLNAGQAQINENGGGSGATESNQRCQNGFGGARNTDTYIQAVSTPGTSNSCDALEIYAIQGSESLSFYEGFDVLTANNIVTAVGSEGFFIQTPDSRPGGSSDTSNGIYVFTGGAPTVAVGDNVDVLGRIVEFFDFTEFTNSPTVTVNSSGNTLPIAKVLNASVPSGDQSAPSCAIEFECYESMLVQVTNGAVTGGNLAFGADPLAEVTVTAATTRTFREPGIIYPGLGGSIPTWDGNPEVFELDPDKLGLTNMIIPGGSTYTATGVIGFEFGDYELWPTSLVVNAASVPRPVRSKVSGETTVGSFNLFRFATDGEYSTRLTKLSRYIRNVLGSPDILAVQEVESMTALQDLADMIYADDDLVDYTAYLVEGNDIGGIDVGFLVQSNIAVDSVTQLGADEIFSYDSSLLHDRPPLLLTGRYIGNGADFPLAVMVLHNRSLNGIDTERVQLKRLTQAESIAEKVQTFQLANPDTPLVVVGDYNAYEFTDGYADVVGHIKGDFNPAESLLSGQDLVNPNLTNQVDLLPANERYSFVFQGNAQALDHALTSRSAQQWVRGMQFGRGNADAARVLLDDPSTAQRSSDHDGLVLFMMTDFDGDGVGDDVDACPANGFLIEWSPDTGCANPVPTLGPAGLLLMLLLLGGLGVFTLRHPYGLRQK